MRLFENIDYIEDIKNVSELDVPWSSLRNKVLVICGATGMLGSFLVDVIMKKNENGLGCKIYALGRDSEKAYKRFENHINSKWFSFFSYDISKELLYDKIENVDFVLQLASNTHPLLYANDPIGTILTNVNGTYNILEFAKAHKAKRILFASSNEIYGENRGDVEFFDEQYCGYIDSNTLRAGYPESKRCGEALCQAYIKQEGMDIVIARLTRSYGPTMLMTDTKAVSQFIKKGISGEDIILKSEGKQYYSYTYVADAVSGLITILLKGKNGEAYNVADCESDIMLRDLANLIASIADKKVIFELPNRTEALGYSTATKARLDGKKLKELGWAPQYNIQTGINRTINILKEIY